MLHKNHGGKSARDKFKNYSRLFLASLMLLLFYSPSWAVPKDVILFPRAARVTEVVRIRLLPEHNGIRKVIITIPGQADTDSLVLYPPQETRLKIEDLRWRRLTRDESSRTKDIRIQIKQLKDEKNSLEALVHALDTQIQFWQQQTKAKVKTQAEAGIVAAAIGKNIRKAFQEKLNQATEIARLDMRIKELYDELNVSGEEDSHSWEVSIFFSGTNTSEVSLTYSYTLSGCGWSPSYILDARPEAGEIMFTRKAEVWQSSGENWNDVNIELAATQPTASLTPFDITPWIIKMPQETKTKGKRNIKKAKESQIPVSSTDSDDEKNESVGQISSILWKLGKKTIVTGSRQKIKIQDEAWSADFSYLARPGKSPYAFINAFLSFPDVKNIPPGNALFLLNGVVLAKKDSIFSFNGQEGNIYFGNDSRITTSSTIKTQENKKKVPSEKNAYHQLKWRIDAENAHTFPIKLRIEEPVPRSSDERIKITLNPLPAPSAQEPSTLIWNFNLSAGEKKTISVNVEIEAPANLEIDPGWR